MSAVISVFSFDSIIYDTNQKSIWTPKVIAATIIMLISGTINTLSFKLEGMQGFHHGMVQTMFTFTGEYLNLLLYGVALSKTSSQESHFYDLFDIARLEGKKVKVPTLLIAIPALVDTIGSCLQNTALLV